MLRNAPVALILLLSGCGLMNQNTTIGQLDADNTLLTDVPLPTVSHEDVRNEYRSLLEIVEEEELRKQTERRVASVYMLEGDHNLLVRTPPPEAGFYTEAISSYNEVIGKYDPAALLMLGDNVYIDQPEHLLCHKYCYYRRQARPEWRRTTASCLTPLAPCGWLNTPPGASLLAGTSSTTRGGGWGQ